MPCRAVRPNGFGGGVALIVTLVLIVGLMPIVPGGVQRAYADGWDGTDVGTATITDLAQGDTVTLYQVASTSLETNNTLKTTWVTAGETGWGTDLTVDAYKSVGDTSSTDYNAATFASDVNTIVGYVKNNTGSFQTNKQTGTATGDDTSGYTAEFSNVPAGLYVVVVSNSSNVTRMYQDSIISVEPTATTPQDGTWSTPTATLALKHSDISVNKYVGSVWDNKGTPIFRPASETTIGAWDIGQGKYTAGYGEGDTVAFEIFAPVPVYSSAATNRTFVVHDVLPAGLTFSNADDDTNSTADVRYKKSSDGKYVTAPDTTESNRWEDLYNDSEDNVYGYTVTTRSNADGTTDVWWAMNSITNFMSADDEIGGIGNAGDTTNVATIRITYEVTVNDKAALKMVNKSQLQYSEDNQSNTVVSTSMNDASAQATAYTENLQVIKQNASEAKLAGAKFNLYRVMAKKYYDYTTDPINGVLTESYSYEKVGGTDSEPVATDENGTLSFSRLAGITDWGNINAASTDEGKSYFTGMYILEEASAPAGYSAANCILIDTNGNTSSSYLSNTGYSNWTTSSYVYGTDNTTKTKDEVITALTNKTIGPNSSTAAVSTVGTSVANTTASFTSSFAADTGTLTMTLTDPSDTSGILPGTGGAGTVAMTVIGLLAMAAAAFALARSRRSKRSFK